MPSSNPALLDSAFAPRVAILGDAGKFASTPVALSSFAGFAKNQAAPAQVVIVDGAVPNLNSLIDTSGSVDLAGAPNSAGPVIQVSRRGDTEVVVLDTRFDGIQQITEALQSHSGLASIQIVSHGGPGELLLGSTVLNENLLQHDRAAIASWGQSLLPGGDILLYGCDIAQGAGGVQFVRDLAGLTGADVAASTNPTGAAALGGDWNLEYRTGPIEAQPAFSASTLAAYDGRLGLDLPTYIQDLLDSHSASFSVTEPLISSASLGGFLNIAGLTLTANAILSSGAWSGTIGISATSATLFPGTSFSAAIAPSAPGQPALTGSFTIGAGFALTAANLTQKLGEALKITASGVNLTYNPSGGPTQTLVALQTASVTSDQFAGMPATTLNNFRLRADGFQFDSFMLASAPGSNPGIGGFLTATGVTLTASNFDVKFGKLVDSTPGAPNPSMSGTVGIAVAGLQLFPEGNFIQLQSSAVTATYDFANFNGTDPTGQLTVTVSGFQLKLGEALQLTAASDVVLAPGAAVVATIGSATLSSPKFTSLGTISVSALEITKSGFTLGNLTWSSTGAVSIGGDIVTMAGVEVTVSNFALDYLKPATESVTWTSSTTIVLAHVPTNLPDVVVISTPSGGTRTVLMQGADYTLVTDITNHIKVVFTGHTPAVGDAIDVSYGYPSISGAVSFAATGVVLFPNIPVLNLTLGSLSGSFDFGNAGAPGLMKIHIGDLNIPLGDAITISLGEVDISPGSATLLHATGVKVKANLFSGLSEVTLPTLDITPTGFRLGTFSIPSAADISIGNFVTFSNASITVSNFKIDKTLSPVISGSMTVTLGSMTLFPGNPVVTSTITGVTGTFNFADIANPGRLTIHVNSLSLSLFSQITLTASDITIAPALDTIATVGTASINFAALNSLSLDIASLAIQKTGFSIASATLNNLPDLTLGSILSLTRPTATVTGFEYNRVQQTATEPTTWSAGTTISLLHKPSSPSTVAVTSKIGSAAATTLVKGTDYNLVTAGGVTQVQFTGHAPVNGEMLTVTYNYFGADTLKGLIGLSAGGALHLGGAFNASIASASATYDLATKHLAATLNTFNLNVAGLADLTIATAALSYTPATDGSAKMLLGAAGVTGFFGVPAGSGSNPVGITLSGGKLAVAVFKPAVGAIAYAMEASGTVALTGLPANSLTFTSGNATFRKSTAGAVHEVVSTDGTEANSLNLDFSGNETSAMGSGLSLSIGSFVSLTADFAFQTFVDTGTTYIAIAANNVNATLAAGTVSLTVAGASVGLILKQGVAGSPTTYALVVNGGTDTLNGIPGFTLTSNGLTVRVRKGLDVNALTPTAIPTTIATPPLANTTTESFAGAAAPLTLLHVPSNFPAVVVTATPSGGTAATLVQGTDYDLVDLGNGHGKVIFTGYAPAATDAITVDYSYQTPQSVTLDFRNLGAGTSDVTDVQGHVAIDVAGFASLEGDFGFQKFTPNVGPVTLAIGGKHIFAKLGTATTNVTVSDATLGFLSQNGTYALLAGGPTTAIALNGVPGLTLSATGVTVKVRKGLDPATFSSLPVIQTSAGDVALDFAGLGSTDVTDVEGHATLAVDGFGSLVGDFGFQSYLDGVTGAKQIAVGAMNLNVTVGTATTYLQVLNASLGLVVRPGVGLGATTYSLIARGSSTPSDTQLVGVPGLALTASNLLVRVRKGLDLSASTGFPNVIHTSGGDVVPDFSGLGSGSTDVLDVQGAVSIAVADFVTLAGEFGFQRYVVGTAPTQDNFFAIGVHGTVSAGTGTETLTLADVSVGVLVKKPAVGSAQFALQAKASSDPTKTTFVGPAGLSLSASDFVVRVRRGLDLSTYPAGVPTTISLPSAPRTTTDPDSIVGVASIALANTNVDVATVAVAATPAGGSATPLTVNVDFTLSTNATTQVTTLTFVAGRVPAAGSAVRISYKQTGNAATLTDPDTIIPAAGSILLVQTGIDNSTVVVKSAPAGGSTFTTVNASDYTLVTDTAGHVTLTFASGSVPAAGTQVRISYTYRGQPVTIAASETLDAVWATDPTVALQFIPANPSAIAVKSIVGGGSPVKRTLGTDYTLGTDASGHTTITFLAGHLPDAGTSVTAAYSYLFPQPLALDFGGLGAGTADITDIEGHAKVAVDGFASIEGDFGFQIYKPTSPPGAIPTFVVGGKNINAVLGTADTNVSVTGAEFGLMIRNGQYVLTARGGTVALNGVPDLTLQSNDLLVKVRKGLDPASVGGGPFVVHTTGGDVTLDFSGLPAGDVTAIQGHAKVDVANFVVLEGDFSFTQSTTGAGSTLKTKILVGASEVEAFIGAADKSVGVHISHANLALVVLKDAAVPGSKYALQASSAVEVVGLPSEVTLSGTATVAINTTGSLAVNGETIPNVPAPAFSFTSGNIKSFGGQLTFAVGSDFSLSGDFSVSKSISGNITKTLIGAANFTTTSPIAATGGSDTFNLSDGKVGIALYRNATTSLGYALSASAHATLAVGSGSVTAGATLNIRRNATRTAQNDTVTIGSVTVPLVFTAGEIATGTPPTLVPFQQISLSNVSLNIDDTLIIQAATGATSTPTPGASSTILTGVSLKLQESLSGPVLFTIAADAAVKTDFGPTPVTVANALNAGLPARGTVTLSEGTNNGDYTLATAGGTTTVNFTSGHIPASGTKISIRYTLLSTPGTIVVDPLTTAGSNTASIALLQTGVDPASVVVTSTPSTAAAWGNLDSDLHLTNISFTLGSYVSFHADSVDLQHYTVAGATVNKFIFTGATVAFLNDGTPMASLSGSATFSFTTGLPIPPGGPNPNGFNMDSFRITDFSFLGQTAELNAGSSPPPVPGVPPSPPPPPPPPGVPPAASTTARKLGPLTLDTPAIALSGFKFDPSGALSAVVTISAAKAIVAVGPATATFTALSGSFEVGAQFDLSNPLSLPTNPFAEFKSITATSLEVKLGTYVTLAATGVVIKPDAAASENLIKFDTISATLNVASISITGSLNKFAIAGDGSFVALPGFGLTFAAGETAGVASSSLGIPSFVPLTGLAVTLQWADFNAHPDRFIIQMSAAVGNIGGLGLTINGSITNVVIDPQKLANGEFPILSIDSAAVSVSGNLVGGEVSGTLIFGVVRFDANGAVVDGLGNLVGKTIPGVAPFTSAFYTGIAASVEIGGTLSFAIRVGISEFGLLQIYLEAGIPIPLGPTGLFLSDFRGGITFGSTFPDVTINDPPQANDALQLRKPAFTTPDKLTAAQWEAQLRAQVARQYKNNPGGGFQAPTGPFIIQAGATIYAANKNAFRIDGDLFIDTSGKILILGTGVFGDNLSVGVKAYTDLSKVFNRTSNSASVLFLMEVPAQPNDLSLPSTYSIFGVLTLTDLPGAFKISLAGAIELNVLDALKARVEATITLTFTANSFNIALSNGQFFIYAIQAAPLGQAAGSLTIQNDAGNIKIWGGFLIVPNLTFLDPFGIHVGGQFFIKLNTTSELKQVVLDLGSNTTQTLDLAPQSFSLLLIGHADFVISGAQVFRLDGTLAIDITNDHLSIFVLTSLLLGPDPNSPIMTFNANGLIFVQLVDAGPIRKGFAAKVTLTTGLNVPNGITFGTNWLLVVNTTLGEIAYTIPTPLPTTPPSPPVATVMGPNYLSTNPLALTSYETITASGVRTLVIPRGAPGTGLSNYSNWVPSSSNAYFIVLGRGNATIANLITLSGNLNILGVVSAGSFSFTLQADASLLIKLNGNTVFSFAIGGAVQLSNAGVAAALAVTFSRNFTLPSNLGFGMSASFLLELNTTGQPKSFTLPSFGTIDIPATQLVLIHGQGHLTLLGSVVDLYGNFDITINSTSLTVGVNADVTFLGATFHAGGFAGIYYDSNPGLALRIDLSLPGGAQGIAPISALGSNFVISGAFKLELNTSSVPRPDQNGVAIAPGFKVAVQNLGVYLYGFNLNGSIAVAITNAGFDFDVDLTLDLFGFANINVAGYYHHDGSFNFTGTAGFQFGNHVFGIGGSISITVANNLFAFSVSGWAAAFGIEISAGGGIVISGTSIDITVRFQVTLFPAVNIDTPDVDMGLFTIPGIHIHTDAVIVGKDATFHLGSISAPPVVAQVIPPAPPPTPPHLAGFIPAHGPNALTLFIGQNVPFRVNDDPTPVLTPALPEENYTLTRVAGDPNSTSGETILVSALNFQQTYTNVQSIYVDDTQAGNDTITIDSGIAVPTYFTLGSGNNTITTGSGLATVTITGGGNNQIVTGNNSTVTVAAGATGNNQITSGTDSLITISAAGNGTNQVAAGTRATVNVGGTENNAVSLTSSTGDATGVTITGSGKNAVNVTGGAPTVTVGSTATNNNNVSINSSAASVMNVNGSGNNSLSSLGSGASTITVSGNGANVVTTGGAPTGPVSTVTLLGSGNNQVSTGAGSATVYDRGTGGNTITGGTGGGTLYYGTVGANGTGAAYSAKGTSSLTTATGNFAANVHGYSTYQLSDYGLKAGNFNLTLSGVKQIALNAAAAVPNAFTLAGWTGAATLTGVGANNTLNMATKPGTTSVNYVLSDSAVQVTGGVSQTIALNAIQTANLVGATAGSNTFTITAWTGNGLLKGPAGTTNAVTAVNDVANYFLSDTLLQRTGRGDMGLSGIQTANLTGGAGANTFTVGNWSGTANLDGKENGDTYNLTLTGSGTGTFNVSDTGTAGTDTLNVTASGTTQLTSTSVRVGTQRVNYGSNGIEVLNVLGGAGGLTYNVQSTNSGVSNSTIQSAGNANTINVSSTAGNLPVAAGNLSGILGKLSVQVGSGANNLLRVSDLGGLVGKTVTLTDSSITGFAPAVINYSVTTGNFTNASGAIDGIKLEGSTAAALIYNILSTLLGSTTQAIGGSKNDVFNVGTAANSLGLIKGQLAIDGLANDATPTTTLSASSIPGSLFASHALPSGDAVNFNDQADSGGFTYALTGSTLNRTGSPQVSYGNLETVNLNAALAPSTIDVTSTAANANTTVTGSINATPTTDAFNIAATGANSNSSFVGGTSDTAFKLQGTGVGSFTRIVGKGGNDTVLVSSNAIAGTRGNTDSINGALAVDAGAGSNNRLTFDDFTGALPTNNVVVNSDAIAGLAPATIFYAATGGQFLNPTTTIYNGVSVLGADGHASTFNIQSTLQGSSTTVAGGSFNDAFNVGTAANSLGQIKGQLALDGLANDATPSTTLSASSIPASLSASHTLPVGDTVNFNDQGDASGYTYGLTATTLDRTGLPQSTPAITYDNLETVNLNAALAPSIINVATTAANVNTTVIGSVNATPTTDAFNIAATGANSNSNFVSGTGDTTFNLQSTGAGSFTRITGLGGNDTVLVSSNAIAGTRGNTDAIDGTLAVDAGAGNTNRLTLDDFTGALATGNVIVNSDAIAGLAPANIFYAATGGHYSNRNASFLDGILISGPNLGGNTFNVRSTLAGSTTQIDGGGANDNFNVSSDAGANLGTLAAIRGHLTLQGGSGSANRLIVSDFGNTDAAAARSNAIQTTVDIGGTEFQQLRNFAGDIAAGVGPVTINYMAVGGFNHIVGSDLEDGVLLVGSNALSNTFNVRTTLAGSTTKIAGGTVADYFVVSSAANANGDPAVSAAPNGTLDGILGNLTLDAGSNAANRLIVSDYAQAATPKSNAIQSAAVIGGTTYQQLRNFAGNGLGANINYVASGGGFTHAVGPTDFADGIQLSGSHALDTTFTFRTTALGTTLMVLGGLANDGFYVGSPPPAVTGLAGNPADSGNLDLIQGQVAVVGNGGSDALAVNDAANGHTANAAHAFNYAVAPSRIVNDPTPVKTVPNVTVPPARTFATNGVIYNASGNAAQNSVTTLRVDGTDDVNIYSVAPSTLTTYTIDGNLPTSGAPIPGGGDYLKLDTTHFADKIGGRQLHINSVGTGFWSFSSTPAARPVNFESIERFNHVDVTAAVETLPNQSPVVTVRDAETGRIEYQVQPYPGITGTASVAVGDLNFDGLPDLIVAPGSNLPAVITIFNGAPDANGNYGHAQLESFPAFAQAFRTGISLATGDLNGDGANELVVGAGSGSGGGYQPTVEVFDGRTVLTGTPAAAPPQLTGAPFLAFDSSFTGGVNVAVGDLNNDGKADIATTRQSGTGTVNVYSYNGSTFANARSFTAYTPAINGGLTDAVGDYNGDGWNDIILGSGVGGSPGVAVYQGGATLFGATTDAPPLLQVFSPSPSTFTGGVLVQATPVNGGDPGTIERAFITAGLQGASSFATYVAPPTESHPTPIQQTTPTSSPAAPPTLIGYPTYAVGADVGGSAVVREFSPDGSLVNTFDPFPGTTGGVRTAVGDFNADGTPDVAVGSGPGAIAEVKVFDGKTGALLFDVRPFETFTGGVFVAAGDITGDGAADLVITPDLSGGPRVEVFRGGDFNRIANFFGIADPNFRGGARAGVGDLNGDGFADLVVSAGFGGGPRLSVYDGQSLAAGREVHMVADFFLFEPELRNGAYVAIGDVNGDGFADIIGGAGPGGGPRVLALSGRSLLSVGAVAAIAQPVANFFAGNIENRGGIRVAAKNLDGDQFADILTGAGPNGGSQVTAYLGKDFANGSPLSAMNFDAYLGFIGGVFVG